MMKPKAKEKVNKLVQQQNERQLLLSSIQKQRINELEIKVIELTKSNSEYKIQYEQENKQNNQLKQEMKQKGLINT